MNQLKAGTYRSLPLKRFIVASARKEQLYSLY